MKTGFIGAGNLARAIVLGLLDKGVSKASDLSCIGGGGSTAAKLADEIGIRLANTRTEIIRDSEIVVLAFKPQHLETITEKESEACNGKLIISVLAGRTLESLKTAFPKASNIVRVMPNTPSRISQGVSGYCFLNTPSETESKMVELLLGALGSSYQVEESQMHIVTALSGCGPAVFFTFIKAYAEAAQARGLSEEQALDMAIETGLGSLELMKASNQSPQSLIDEVVSPNGVTHALLTSLDKQSWTQILDTATQDAVNRSRELAGES